MSYTIVKDVLAPRRNSYPFKHMDVGDSFLVPFDQVKDSNSLRSAASHYARRHGSVRFTITTEAKGFRVFRIE